jgi:hypothetical protein
MSTQLEFRVEDVTVSGFTSQLAFPGFERFGLKAGECVLFLLLFLFPHKFGGNVLAYYLLRNWSECPLDLQTFERMSGVAECKFGNDPAVGHVLLHDLIEQSLHVLRHVLLYVDVDLQLPLHHIGQVALVLFQHALYPF